MSKGIIIHLDDDSKNILEPSKAFFDQLGIDLELISCKSEKEFNSILNDREGEIRVLIFDLLSSDPDQELISEKDAKFLKNIKEGFANFNVPIFIYSGFTNAVEGLFSNYGNVYIIDKGKYGFDYITDKIKLFYESGFLDVFTSGGIIDKIKHDLHRTFTSQFISNEELESTINLIVNNSDGDHINRIKRVFTRISMRTLLSELHSPIMDEKGEKIIEEHLALTEHYIRRINNQIRVFTGDIFVSTKNINDAFLVLTPRCNVIRAEEYLVCPLVMNDFPKKTSGQDNVKKIELAAQGDPKYSGFDRHLPPSPIFKGGRLLISKYRIISIKEIDNYERAISLSDELTNEILGKFGSYFFRTGIIPWDQAEMVSYISEN